MTGNDDFIDPNDRYTQISETVNVDREKVKQIIVMAGYVGQWEPNKRMKAAYTACTGIPTEALEAGVIQEAKKLIDALASDDPTQLLDVDVEEWAREIKYKMEGK